MTLLNRGLLASDINPITDEAPPKKKGGRAAGSPTVRSLKRLREAGWLADKVEQRLAMPGHFVTKDLFGFGDILAVNEDLGVLIVQTTSGDNVSKRLRKMDTPPEEGEPDVRAALIRCLRAGIHVEAHGWAKRGLRGERKLWKCRVVTAKLLIVGNDYAIGWEEEP